MNKKRLTIIIGAGAVTELSGVSCQSITNELLTSSDIKEEVKELFNKIHKSLNESNNKWDDYNPNFEDIFHSLEILSSLFVDNNAAPEFKTIYKIFTNIKNDYMQYNPYNHSSSYKLTLSFAFDELLNVIIKQIKTYSDKEVEGWYRDFFIKLSENYNLNIFTLNYDNWFEKIFPNYNDGFVNTNDKSPYLEFLPQKSIDLTNKININHLHGQIDFSFINNPQDAKKDFNDDEFYTIYKVKNPQKTKPKFTAGSFKHTQGGEYLKNTTIITGKMKTEKIAYSPFDLYRTNLQRSVTENPNLLIIGYGFADYYVNNILGQFRKIHSANARVNIIDWANPNVWNNNIITREQISQEKFATFYNIFKDKTVETMLRQKYSPCISFNNTSFLYLDGFKNTATNNIEKIINSYRQ